MNQNEEGEIMKNNEKNMGHEEHHHDDNMMEKKHEHPSHTEMPDEHKGHHDHVEKQEVHKEHHQDQNMMGMEHEHHHHADMMSEHKEHHDHVEQHEDHTKHAMHEGHGGHDHHEHHAHMVQDFKKRFWVSLILTVPILLLSPMVQQFLGIEQAIQFTGDKYLLFLFSTFVFFYGGYPF